VKLLLDTHIWLWSLLEPERLGPRTRAALGDATTELWLSPISVWETLLLAERQRIHLQPDPGTWVGDQLSKGPVREAALNAEVAMVSRRLFVASNDPADRFIAATSEVYDLTLVTADARLRRVRGVSILPNT
jgi:PIN domain nuclease of toxin-antitoxin system